MICGLDRCGVAIAAAVAVNHGAVQPANERAQEGFSQQTVGSDPTHMEACPGQDDSISRPCFQKHEGIPCSVHL